MEKSLDLKLAHIHADPSSATDFILADAKDADMAFGLAAPGQSPEYHGQEGRFRSLAEYRDLIREIVRQGLVDIMLMSGSNSEILTIEERLFDHSPVTPATRANDTSDVHLPRGNTYWKEPSRPFSTSLIDQMQCGKVECSPEERRRGTDLGLYSVTFNNDLQGDLHTLERYKYFREEAERKGFRHFLEVFDPNRAGAIDPALLGHFINDHIARLLAGVPRASRPIFLKIVYHGPGFMEELAAYDPHLIPGILGGASGTTYDAFKLLAEARKHGARAALFGRKINNSEHQLTFVRFLRHLAEGEIEPEEAVVAYHDAIQKLGIRPYRSLDKDMELTNPAVSYAGGSRQSAVISVPALPFPEGSTPTTARESSPCPYPLRADGSYDFSVFTQEMRLRYNQEQRDRVFGNLFSR